jgi:hypothetical protein
MLALGCCCLLLLTLCCCFDLGVIALLFIQVLPSPSFMLLLTLTLHWVATHLVATSWGVVFSSLLAMCLEVGD